MAMNPRLLAPRATGFNPKSISGLSLWLDASQSSSVTLNSGNVSQWSDLSGNGRNFTQATAAAQPLYATAAMNGRSVVRADGTNHSMSQTAGTSINAASITMIFAMRHVTWQAGVAKYPNLFDTDLTAFEPDGLRFEQYNNAESAVVGDTNSFQALPVLTTSAVGLAPRVLTFTANSATLGLAVRSNGAASASVTVTATNYPTAFATGTRGPFFLFVGFWNVAERRSNAEIGELLIYNRALSTSELQQAERGLGRKWGITVA